jgi:hypothetical protein
MKEKFFIWIKRSFPIFWKLAEDGNDIMLGLIHEKKLKKVKERYSGLFSFKDMSFRLLGEKDLPVLYTFLSTLDEKDYTYFRPHGFDRKSIARVLQKRLFLPFGVFNGNVMVGYCFLRLFFTGTAFIGRIVKPDYQGKKIGQNMGLFMHRVADEIKFTMYSTISEKNSNSLISHQKNENIEIVKKLHDGYLLVKFVHNK